MKFLAHDDDSEEVFEDNTISNESVYSTIVHNSINDEAVGSIDDCRNVIKDIESKFDTSEIGYGKDLFPPRSHRSTAPSSNIRLKSFDPDLSKEKGPGEWPEWINDGRRLEIIYYRLICDMYIVTYVYTVIWICIFIYVYISS